MSGDEPWFNKDNKVQEEVHSSLEVPLRRSRQGAGRGSAAASGACAFMINREWSVFSFHGLRPEIVNSNPKGWDFGKLHGHLI